MANSLPERWLEYKSVGNVIKDTQILAFKVPLKEAIVKNLEPEQRFTTTKLLQAFPRLKYIVDLTNTFRYYDKKEFTDVGVKYEKIAIPGRKIPAMNMIKKFFKVMDDFTSACGQDELIGIHCTHGVNRTGYLICRYLIQQLGWEIQDSLKAFGEARGYPIERDIYLAALQEVQRGEKIDTSKIILHPTNIIEIPSAMKKTHLALRPQMGVMGPPGFAMSRRGVANGALFPPQRYGFAGPPPGFRSMPPPPGLPPMGPPLYGARHRYGMPMRPTLPTPPGPGFPLAGFPLRIPGPSRMAGPPMLPPVGPAARLPLPKIPPPPLPPPPPHSRTSVNKHLQKKKQIRNGMIECANVPLRRNGPLSGRIIPKMLKEQDFTVDTFEENLLTSSTSQLRRRPTKGRYSQAK